MGQSTLFYGFISIDCSHVFFLLLSQRFDFENTVTSKFMNRQTAVKLPIKNKGSAFLFTDTVTTSISVLTGAE